MFELSRRRARAAAVVVGLAVPMGGIGTLALTTASAASARCPHGRHHHKTPHKDLDGDRCDRHGLDDGDGARI